MNRLQHETSPYLLQHADNPVDWFPWGDEAFAQAKADDKPILLSVGYSACHWCHVMAHESFEHGPTADLMNQLFVNIKVDREERPDVDDIYMQAVQAMTQHGGWPMTVFLTPDGRPFYGGTYFPREDRYGVPSFRRVLQSIHQAWTDRRDEIEEQASKLADALNRDALNIDADVNGLDAELLDMAAKGVLDNFDAQFGGFGSAPKFPQPMNLAYLLRHHARTGDADALHAVTFTLTKMARGGMYDQIGGGFARYSVDRYWLVPHFEKMLYDNAQLSRLYLHAWQATGDDFFKRIAEDIYDYILREMTAPEGGFYSATDADSEGEEGKFFVWDKAEIESVLAEISDEVPDAAKVAVEYYGVTRSGNFEGKNILYVPNDDATVAARLGMTVDALRETLKRVNDHLYAARTRRVHPGLDDKVLTSWNGMMLASLAEAGRVLKREDYTAAAERCAEFITSKLMTEDYRLHRTYKNGIAKGNGYLEDYANLIDALLELYQTTFVQRWYTTAKNLADVVLKHFAADDGGFFDTSDDHEKLIVRPRALQDNAVPSGNSMIAKQLARLVAYTGDADYDDAARKTLRPLIPAMQQVPQAFGEALNAADMLITGIAEVAIVGNPTRAGTRALLDVVRGPYRPNVVTALAREDVAGDSEIPLLSYRKQVQGAPTAYVCRHFTCKLPVTTPEETATLLSEAQ